jgi:hypothetical protein
MANKLVVVSLLVCIENQFGCCAATGVPIGNIRAGCNFLPLLYFFVQSIFELLYTRFSAGSENDCFGRKMMSVFVVTYRKRFGLENQLLN